MDENLLRQEIRKTLIETFTYNNELIAERHAINLRPGEFSEIFFEPWKNVVKGAFVDLKKIASQALTTVRLMFTLNQKKAEEIVARQKDRMKKFDAESAEIFSKLGGEEKLGDFYAASFLLAPGAYLTSKIASSAPGTVSGVIDVAKELGVGDKSINTVTGEEQEEDALIRRRDQDGPIKKALRAIEQIFFLAHAAPSGQLLQEAAVPESMEQEIMTGPLGPEIQEAREAMFEAASEITDIVASIAAQNEFMASVGQQSNVDAPEKSLKQMNDALARLKSVDPESAETFATLPREISDNATKMANDENFVAQERAKSDEVSEADIQRAALKAVLGATFNDMISEFTEAIGQNQEILEELIFSVFPEEILTKDIVSTIDSESPGFANAMSKAQLVLGRNFIS